MSYRTRNITQKVQIRLLQDRETHRATRPQLLHPMIVFWGECKSLPRTTRNTRLKTPSRQVELPGSNYGSSNFLPGHRDEGKGCQHGRSGRIFLFYAPCPQPRDTPACISPCVLPLRTYTHFLRKTCVE